MPNKDPVKRLQTNRASSKRHYEKNRKKIIAQNNAYRRRTRARWATFKATLFCIKCGENHPATLDFHHVIRTKDNRKVHKLIQSGAWTAAQEEIKKCVVLCANCHRKHHYDERQEEKLVRKRKKKVAKKK